DDIQPERLAVKGGYAENGQRTKQLQFRVAIGIWMELRVVQNTVCLQPLAQGVDERLVRRTAPAANPQFQIFCLIPTLQQNERLDQSVQALLAAHPRKIAEDGNYPLFLVG